MIYLNFLSPSVLEYIFVFNMLVSRAYELKIGNKMMGNVIVKMLIPFPSH